MRLREWLIGGIPLSLKRGIAGAIGLFLRLIGLKNLGLVVANPATLVSMGNITATPVLLGCGGFVLMAALFAAKFGEGQSPTPGSPRPHQIVLDQSAGTNRNPSPLRNTVPLAGNGK